MSRFARRLLPLWFACVCGCTGSGAGKDATAPKTATAQAVQAVPAAPSVVLLPPGRDAVSVKVEVARDEEQRRRGLMFRKHMDEDAGMLFLFERAEHLTFWMHNTYMPLDMIFIDPDLRILGVVENAEPLTDDARAVPGISKYVLEVNAGFSRRYGLTAGSAVRFDGIEVAHAQ